MNDNKENLFLELPIIPLRGIVVFPKMVLHFDVGRRKSVKALQKAMDDDQRVFLVCQKDASVDEPNVRYGCYLQYQANDAYSRQRQYACCS